MNTPIRSPFVGVLVIALALVSCATVAPKPPTLAPQIAARGGQPPVPLPPPTPPPPTPPTQPGQTQQQTVILPAIPLAIGYECVWWSGAGTGSLQLPVVNGQAVISFAAPNGFTLHCHPTIQCGGPRC